MKLMEKQFEIKILELNWLQSIEESEDLCAHGKLYVRIGDEIICDEEMGEFTLSSTAFYLMQTVYEDYKIGDYGSQLIPCCGHFFISDESGETAAVIGCPNGIDWTIRHVENNQVKHISTKGTEGKISKEDYQKLIIEFVNQVERFYDESKPKEMPKDESDHKGYITFWKEWKKLKKEIEKN